MTDSPRRSARAHDPEPLPARAEAVDVEPTVEGAAEPPAEGAAEPPADDAHRTRVRFGRRGFTPHVGGTSLALLGGQTVEEALRLVPGLVIAQHGTEGKGHQIYLRGFDALHGSGSRNERGCSTSPRTGTHRPRARSSRACHSRRGRR